MIPESPHAFQTENTYPVEDVAVARFIRFLERIGLKEMLAKVSDRRQQSKIRYSHVSLLLSALSVFFFRQQSKNSLNTVILSLPKHKKTALSKFLGVNGDLLPKRDCIDDYLSQINYEEINLLLIKIFQWAKTNKLFYNHAEKLLPFNRFHIGVDGFWVHKYSVPHSVGENGENCCPYCLPRVHNKGTPKENTYWVHAFVTFVLVFPGGLKFPIHIYPLKAVQVNVLASDEKLKQECELQAAHKVLPELKALLGRIPVTFLGDSLYANEPMIKLLEQLNWDYLIVRKEKTFSSVAKKCDELDTSEYYQKNFRDKEITTEAKGKKSVQRTAKWFNNTAVGKASFTNVLRFSEVVKSCDGNLVSEFNTEWLSSIAISKGNWRMMAGSGRMRWEHEDAHNTFKNRGFAAKHDYARSDPNLCMVWKLLMFLGFLIFELFRLTTVARESKGKLSWMKFAISLLHQLVELSWDVISRSPILRKAKVQFRYDFDSG